MKRHHRNVLGAIALTSSAALAVWACAPAVAPAPSTPGATTASAVPASPAAAIGSNAPVVSQDRRPPLDGPSANAAGQRRRQVSAKWHDQFKGGFEAKQVILLTDKGRNVTVDRMNLKSGVIGPNGAITMNGKASATIAGRPTREVAIATTIHAPMSDAPNTLSLTDAISGGTLDFTADPEYVRFTGKSAKGSFTLVVNPDGTLSLDGKPTDGGEGTAKALVAGFAAEASPEQLAMLEGLIEGSEYYAKQVGLASLYPAPQGPSTNNVNNVYRVFTADGFDPRPLVRAVLAKRLAP